MHFIFVHFRVSVFLFFFLHYISKAEKKTVLVERFCVLQLFFLPEKHTAMCLKSARLMCTYVEAYEHLHVLQRAAIIFHREDWG